LGGTVKDVTNLSPVNQIAAMEDRKPGKILEGRSDQIVVITDPADGGVRITT
jgi:hypothetical protein